jgi:hypothetical protein
LEKLEGRLKELEERYTKLRAGEIKQKLSDARDAPHQDEGERLFKSSTELSSCTTGRSCRRLNTSFSKKEGHCHAGKIRLRFHDQQGQALQTL